MNNPREVAYALLRVTVGVMFLFFGIGKFVGGVGNFAAGMAQHFAGKLPSALVLPFSYALPFAEVTLGALILLGLFNAFAFGLSGCCWSRSPSAPSCSATRRRSRTTSSTPW